MIPGTCPVLERELVDLDGGLDANPNWDHKEWLPQVLLDFIEVSFLRFGLGVHIALPMEHNIRHFNNNS